MVEFDDDKVRAMNQASRTGRDGVTLVAFFGTSKPDGLSRLVRDIGQYIEDRLAGFRGLFDAYPMPQVHATIVGLEATRVGGHLLGDVALARQSRFNLPARPVDFAGLTSFLQAHHWPFRFRLGGYTPVESNPYDSAKSPWQRTFEFQRNGMAVVMGWPCLANGRPFAPLLVGLRKSLEVFGIVHKYHCDPLGVDNDLFLVLGTLNSEAWDTVIAAGGRIHALEAFDDLQERIRLSLLAHPIFVDMDLQHLRVVRYGKTTLGHVRHTTPVDVTLPSSVHALYGEIASNG